VRRCRRCSRPCPRQRAERDEHDEAGALVLDDLGEPAGVLGDRELSPSPSYTAKPAFGPRGARVWDIARRACRPPLGLVIPGDELPTHRAAILKRSSPGADISTGKPSIKGRVPLRRSPTARARDRAWFDSSLRVRFEVLVELAGLHASHSLPTDRRDRVEPHG
jgi:hypothetical protein